VGDVEHVEVDVAGWPQALPVWMTDEDRCALMTIGFEPFCSLESLYRLASLIRSIEL